MRFIGNKTALLPELDQFIHSKVTDAHSFCDLFSGTASVGRYFKSQYEIISNDLMYFSYCLAQATIEQDSVPTFDNLVDFGMIDPIDYLNESVYREELPQSYRFFQSNYSPLGGRMYITEDNALRIDYARYMIEKWFDRGLISHDESLYLIACLIEGIPYISNIAGTYGAYHKFWDKWALNPFQLKRLDVVSNGQQNRAYHSDANELIQTLTGDILYLDPPYNQCQYNSNYHVLETAARFDFPQLKGVTGQRVEKVGQSQYGSEQSALEAFEDLIKQAQFKHVFVSYSADGVMHLCDVMRILKEYGKSETFDAYAVEYRRYKSQENTEHSTLNEVIFYIEKDVSRL